MLDDVTAGASTPLPRCMWCSAELPTDSEVTCPTCGATLIGEGDSQVPGVTAIDAEAIVRGSRDKPRQRSRLMSWISGEYPEQEQQAPPGSLAPPPPEVRREMLRIELEAEVANLQAEAGAIAAEHVVDAVEAGVTLETETADGAPAIATAPDAAPAPAGPAAAAPVAAAPAAPDAEAASDGDTGTDSTN